MEERPLDTGGTTAERAAGATQAVLGVGFGVGAVIALRHLREMGELPMTPFGFRAFSGPFERLGQPTFEALLGGFAALCAIDVVAGALLWQGRRVGYALGAVTALPSFVLSVGFALPFMLIGIPLRGVMMLLGRRESRASRED